MNTYKPETLFIDDEQPARNLASKSLGTLTGTNVRTSHIVANAKNKILNLPLDGIFVDIRLPEEEDGLDLIQTYRRVNPYGYIAAFSANASFEDDAIAKGADIFYSKPFHNDKFYRLAQSMRTGIYHQRLNRLIDLVPLNLDIWFNLVLDYDENDYLWYKLLYDLNFTADKLELVKSRFELREFPENDIQLSIRNLCVDLIESSLISFIKSVPSLIPDYLSMNERKKFEAKPFDINKSEFDKLVNFQDEDYLGKFVAIVKGTVVDSDSSIDDLLDRVEAAYPSDERFVSKVTRFDDQPPKIWRPRFIVNTDEDT